MEEVISRYQIAVDIEKIKQDAYQFGCLDKYVSFCPLELNASPTQVFTASYEDAYRKIKDEALTNEDWEAANKRADEIYQISLGSLDAPAYLNLVDEFYKDVIPRMLVGLEKDRDDRISSLLQEFNARAVREEAERIALLPPPPPTELELITQYKNAALVS